MDKPIDIEALLMRLDRYLLIGAGDAIDEAVEGNNLAMDCRAVIRILRERVKAADELSAATREVHADGDQMVTAMGCPLCIAVVAYDATKGTP